MSLKIVKVSSLNSLEKELLQTHVSRLYGFILAAVGLASTLHHAFLYDSTHPINFYLVFFITIYLVAIMMLTWLLVWIRRKKQDVNSISNTINNFGEGFNLYLKSGVILFTGVCVVYNVLRIVHLFQTGFMHCGGVSYFMFCVGQASFLILTAVLFTLHDRVVIQEPTLMIRLIFTHLLVCCICTWFHAGIGEIREGLENEMKKENTNRGKVHECVDPDHDIIKFSMPYFLPVMVELTLLEAPMFFDFLERMQCLYQQQHLEETIVPFPKLHMSKRGLAIGFVVILISIVLITVMYAVESNLLAAVAVYYIESISMSVLGLFVAVLVYIKLRPLRLHASEGTAVDRHILWVSLYGSLVFSFLEITASSYMLTQTNVSKKYVLLDAVDLVDSLLNILEICLQGLVIINMMHRVVRDQSDVENKPGRGLLALLLCINLSLWIVHTFEVKKTEAYEMLTEKSKLHYLEVTYVLQHVAKPLVILFRFHCTVCLSMAWSYIYDAANLEGNDTSVCCSCGLSSEKGTKEMRVFTVHNV